MTPEGHWRLRELPRETLEDMALRAAWELRALRADGAPNRLFLGCCLAFVAGAGISAAGFIVGAMLH
jgi:hypothetical protein